MVCIIEGFVGTSWALIQAFHAPFTVFIVHVLLQMGTLQKIDVSAVMFISLSTLVDHQRSAELQNDFLGYFLSLLKLMTKDFLLFFYPLNNCIITFYFLTEGWKI